MAAVLCANLAKVDVETLNAVCAGFLVLRALYAVVYIGVTKSSLSYVRSVIWMASVGCCLYLLVISGGIVANGGSVGI